jgi:16S rRNA (cytosine1402-N4)-methyltransferase
MNTDAYVHTPVLLEEVLSGLNIRPDGIYVDCTFGRGGHSRKILESLGENGRLIVFDKDPDAISKAAELSTQDPRVHVIHAPFSALGHNISAMGKVGQVNGILFDLGVSSPQLDDSERGFSFSRDGNLDMRMDPGTGMSAADWINTAELVDIAHVLKVYGEEKFSRRIATAIVISRAQKPIKTTAELAGIISGAVPARELKKHPATRAFQAIRIYINNELEELASGLEQAFEILALNGRLLVISFHSLEDRIVKRFMRDRSLSDPYPKEVPVTADMIKPRMRISGKALRPSAAEVSSNPRARSAVLRIAEKLTA